MLARRLLGEQTESEVLQYHKEEGWTSKNATNGVKMWYKKSPHFAGYLHKFEYDIDVQDDIVYSVMKPPTVTAERLSWDKSIKHFECLEQESEDIMVGLIITHSAVGGWISSREFVDLYYFKPHIEILADGDFDRVSWIFAQSIDYSARPKTAEYVRAWNYPTGYAVSRYRNDPGKCKLTLYVNVDIRGRVPRYLVDKALPAQQVSYIESVERQARKIQC